MGIIWTDPTPDNTCQLCAHHVDHVFAEDYALPLPAHNGCQCYYRPDTEDRPLSVLDWDEEPEFVRQHWSRYLAWMLRSGMTTPAALRDLIPAAEAINQARKETETMTTDLSPTFINSHALHLAATDKPREYRARLIKAGRIRNALDEPGAFTVEAEAIKTAVINKQFDGLACFIDHSDWLSGSSIRNLFGVWRDVQWDEEQQGAVGTLRLYDNPETAAVADRLDQMLADAAADIPIPDIGVSLTFYPVWRPRDNYDEPKRLMAFRKIESADIVFTPAADGRLLEALSALSPQAIKENNPMPQEIEQAAVTAPAPIPTAAAPNPWLEQLEQTVVTYALSTSGLPQATQARIRSGRYATPQELTAAIDAAKTELAALAEESVIQMGGQAPRQAVTAGDMIEPLEQVESHVNWMFGVEGAELPPFNYRRVDQLYVALTGDVSFNGQFDGSRVQLNASPITLPNLALNALNKVVMQQFSLLAFWRWYELVVTVTPNDGSLHDPAWITYGGTGNLPIVVDGAAYTEGELDDAKETSAFNKHGRYVGITRKMIKNSDITRIQAVAKALGTDSIRTRSASIASIFTANSGQGPTMADGNAAFKSGNENSNYATTALGSDTTAWEAASAECFNHTELGSGKKIGVFAKNLLVPSQLYFTGLKLFGYGDGNPTSYNPFAQSRSPEDPRPIVLPVPDWTDANDWAYSADPALWPTIMMTYSANPSGKTHPMPELFTVVGETAGLMFTNDTMPIKVRDEFAYGLATAKGIGKRIVT